MSTLIDYLSSSASRWPDRIAVVDPGGQGLTYAELDARSSALAGFLASRGVAPGDRVGVVLPKSATTVVALFGIMKAGAAYVPIDHSAPAERSRGILTDCQVRAVVVDVHSRAVVPPASDLSLAATLVVGESFEAALAETLPAPTPGLDGSRLAYI